MRISDWSSDVCSSDLDGRQHDAVDLDRRLFDEMISLHNLPLPFQKLRPALRAEQAVRHQAILFLPRAHPAVGRGTEQAVGSEATNAALHFLYRFPAIALAQHQAMRRDRQWRDDRRARDRKSTRLNSS